MPGDGQDGGTDWDKVKIEGGNANLSSRIILAMTMRLKDAQDAGGLSQEDMLFLVERYLQLGLHFQRGGEANRLKVGVVADARTQVLAYAKSKGGILSDYKMDPKARVVTQRAEDVANPPKPSDELYHSLNNLQNYVFSEHEYQRATAFSDVEGAFSVLYYMYRLRLAADVSAETLFRQSIARLRHSNKLH